MSSKSKSKTHKPSEVMSLKKADIGNRRGPMRSARKDAASVSQAEADDKNEPEVSESESVESSDESEKENKEPVKNQAKHMAQKVAKKSTGEPKIEKVKLDTLLKSTAVKLTGAMKFDAWKKSIML